MSGHATDCESRGLGLCDCGGIEQVDASTLQVGDVILPDPHGYPETFAEVVREGIESSNMFGMPLLRYWVRAVDGSDQEGYASYGPGGVAWRAIQ